MKNPLLLAPSLPPPLLPENIDPTVLIPELQPREPAPYSSVGCSEDSAEERVDNLAVVEEAELECPMCDERFGGDCHEALQQHVDQHLESVVECPLCGKTYDKKNQKNIYIRIKCVVHKFTLKWDDPKYNIHWPIKNPIMSERDAFA